MGIRVAVAGGSGYAGGELLRLLAGHPDLEIAAVSAGSSAGKPITSIHPNLTGHPAFDGKNFAETTAEALGDAELIFMALPHGESAVLAAQLPDARIVDLSADFRLGDEAAWHQFYGDVSYAGRWAYGLPELPGAVDKIKAAHPDVQVFVYPGVGHGFNCNKRPDFNEEAAKLAKQRTLELFRANS